MPTKYIKDLLDLPTQGNKGDFVLNLAPDNAAGDPNPALALQAN